MADFASQLSQTPNVPVIDGVASAVGLASGLVRLGRQGCATVGLMYWATF
ncbi:MAG: hypothetical protein ACJ04N_04080 [Oceanospirillaceae bacterium]|nr:hypothetical protein [Pseudomonadales bacterium]